MTSPEETWHTSLEQMLQETQAMIRQAQEQHPDAVSLFLTTALFNNTEMIRFALQKIRELESKLASKGYVMQLPLKLEHGTPLWLQHQVAPGTEPLVISTDRPMSAMERSAEAIHGRADKTLDSYSMRASGSPASSSSEQDTSGSDGTTTSSE